MEPIEVIYSFNDNYAELAAVSMTSLVYNTNRDCHIHIFENSVSDNTLSRIMKLEEMYANAKITVHHIPNEMFEEVANDKRFGKEAWYPMLAPEILSDLDKVLLLEPDTLVCRDISELYDISLGNCYVAARRNCATNQDYDFFPSTSKPYARLNVAVTLYNLKAIRENDLFNMSKLIKTTQAIKPYFSLWLVQESYQSYLFQSEDVVFLESKYSNSLYVSGFLYGPFNCREHPFDKTYEAINNPVVIHYAMGKPNVVPNNNDIDVRFPKWWEYLALSPYADPEKSSERLDNIYKQITRFRNTPLNEKEYMHYCLYFDMLEMVEKLKEFSAAGMKIVFYGAGDPGWRLIRFVRYLDITVDNICDWTKCGRTLDGIKIDSPEILENLCGECVVVITLKDTKVWSSVFNNMIDMGHLEKHILPIFEPLAAGGRRWGEIMQSVKV